MRKQFSAILALTIALTMTHNTVFADPGLTWQSFLQSHPNFEQNHPQAYQFLQSHPDQLNQFLQNAANQDGSSDNSSSSGSGSSLSLNNGSSQSQSKHERYQQFLKNHPEEAQRMERRMRERHEERAAERHWDKEHFDGNHAAMAEHHHETGSANHQSHGGGHRPQS